jgi:hypothetical protein
MKKVLLGLILTVGILVSKAQSFTFTKMYTTLPTLGSQTVDVKGEIIMTDSTITQNVMNKIAITPIIKVNEYGDYKSKNGDYDIRYKFIPVSETAKDGLKDKKGRWIIKEMEFATHVLITDMVDRFTNQHTNVTIYLTPKIAP